MEALASGLNRSVARFMWIVKTGMACRPSRLASRPGWQAGWRVVTGVCPAGADTGPSGRGRIPEPPQVELGLGAVVAEKAVLAWPMGADWFVNAQLLMKDMGVTVRVCEWVVTMPDPDKLGRSIVGIMREDLPERARAQELRSNAPVHDSYVP